MAAVSQQYIVIFSMLLRKQDTGLTHLKYLYLMLHCQICKINLSYRCRFSLSPIVDKALIVGDFHIHVDNKNDALGLAFTFTFTHLVDAFIQSDLHCIQVTVSTFYQVLPDLVT